MRARIGFGIALGVILGLQLPAHGMLGMPESELERRYSWEAGPEGTRLYHLGAATFSPLFSAGKLVGAIAELPPGAGASELRQLLEHLTRGLRQTPALEGGTLEEADWQRVTPDYRAWSRREGKKTFVLIQQNLPAPSPSDTLPRLPQPFEDPFYRAEGDLAILRAALESYRASHYFRYPAVANLDALLDALKRAEVLPEGFQLHAPLTEFEVWKTGYRITVRAGGRKVGIQQPERFDPFWVYWQIRPYP